VAKQDAKREVWGLLLVFDEEAAVGKDRQLDS
jgi:hypothetical protein